LDGYRRCHQPCGEDEHAAAGLELGPADQRCQRDGCEQSAATSAGDRDRQGEGDQAESGDRSSGGVEPAGKPQLQGVFEDVGEAREGSADGRDQRYADDGPSPAGVSLLEQSLDVSRNPILLLLRFSEICSTTPNGRRGLANRRDQDPWCVSLRCPLPSAFMT
jgi:hypothetical protein